MTVTETRFEDATPAPLRAQGAGSRASKRAPGPQMPQLRGRLLTLRLWRNCSAMFTWTVVQ